MFGDNPVIDIDDRTNSIIKTLLERDPVHFLDSAGFCRKTLDLFQPLSEGEKENDPYKDERDSSKLNNPISMARKGVAAGILEDCLAISGKLISIEGEDPIHNHRKVRSEMTLKVLGGDPGGSIPGLRQDSPEQMRLAIKRMRFSNQDFAIMEDLCLKADTYNPWRAAKRFVVESVRWGNLPKKVRDQYKSRFQEDTQFEEDTSESLVQSTTGVGASGTFLSDSSEVHVARIPGEPERTVLAGPQAMLSFFRNWPEHGVDRERMGHRTRAPGSTCAGEPCQSCCCLRFRLV